MAREKVEVREWTIPNLDGSGLITIELRQKNPPDNWLEELLRELLRDDMLPQSLDNLLRERWIREQGWDSMPGERPWVTWDRERRRTPPPWRVPSTQG